MLERTRRHCYAPFNSFLHCLHARRYSVLSTVARRTVQVRVYADRIVVRCGDEVVAERPRYFGRNRTIYDPWHYLPMLARKPGALRNGAPFQDWGLPPAPAHLRRKLGNDDGHSCHRSANRRPKWWVPQARKMCDYSGWSGQRSLIECRTGLSQAGWAASRWQDCLFTAPHRRG